MYLFLFLMVPLWDLLVKTELENYNNWLCIEYSF